MLINFDDDLFRQFFSAAHEYAHVLFDRQDVDANGCIVSFRHGATALVETRAHAFAAEFLLPQNALSRYSKPADIHQLPESIEQIARDYLVNTETVAIRMKEKGWIGENTLKSFQKVRPVTIPRAEKTDPDIPSGLSPSQQKRRRLAIEEGISSCFLELLRTAIANEAISFGRAAEMLDMSHRNAVEFIKEVGLAI